MDQRERERRVALATLDLERTASKRRPWLRFQIRAVFLLVIVALNVLGWTDDRPHSPMLPDSIAGYTRFDSAAVKTLQEQTRNLAREMGGPGIAGAYRKPGRSFTVQVFFNPLSRPLDRDLFMEAATDVTADHRLIVLTSVSESALESNGVAWECAPVNGEFVGALCVWNDFIKTAGVMLGSGIDVSDARAVVLQLQQTNKA